MLKNTITVFLFLFTASIWGQSITNTLGSNGLFYVKDVSSNSLFTLNSSGQATLNGSLTLTNGSSSITLPSTDGNANQVLTTNGSGSAYWSTPFSLDTQSIKFLICVVGTQPNPSGGAIYDYFVGQIIMFAGPNSSNIPGNFMECKGQILNVNDNTALYSVIGNTYGGSPGSTFALPNFTSKVPEGQ